jgi:nucleotide-binding universal stress UspA family protein
MLPAVVLVPTDLSVEAERAFDYACDLARELDATVHLLHVIGIPALGVPELGVALTAQMIDSLITEHRVAVEALADKHRKDTRIGEVLLKTGDARDMINQTAKNLHVDLIAMGTHGRRGVSRALLGSVAESVVRSAPCPVLTVRSPHS